MVDGWFVLCPFKQRILFHLKHCNLLPYERALSYLISLPLCCSSSLCVTLKYARLVEQEAHCVCPSETGTISSGNHSLSPAGVRTAEKWAADLWPTCGGGCRPETGTMAGLQGVCLLTRMWASSALKPCIFKYFMIPSSPAPLSDLRFGSWLPFINSTVRRVSVDLMPPISEADLRKSLPNPGPLGTQCICSDDLVKCS